MGDVGVEIHAFLGCKGREHMEVVSDSHNKRANTPNENV
jgi:hypothetical protein